MSDRPNHPEPESAGGPEGGAGVDERELELPPSLVAGLKSRFGAPVEVPAYVDAVVLTEWAEQLASGRRLGRRSGASGRRRAWQFAGLAAAVGLMAWVGMSMLKRPTPASSLLAQGGGLSGAVAEGVGEDRTTMAKAELKKERDASSNRFGSGGRSGDPAASLPVATDAPAAPTLRALASGVDADHNGRVNVLDVMRVAKTVQAVQLAKQTGLRPGVKLSPADAAKLAFYVETFDASWDVNGDGVVDRRDVEALASRLVRVGGS